MAMLLYADAQLPKNAAAPCHGSTVLKYDSVVTATGDVLNTLQGDAPGSAGTGGRRGDARSLLCVLPLFR
jgi:hypothetical protein